MAKNFRFSERYKSLLQVETQRDPHPGTFIYNQLSKAKDKEIITWKQQERSDASCINLPQ